MKFATRLTFLMNSCNFSSRLFRARVKVLKEIIMGVRPKLKIMTTFEIKKKNLFFVADKELGEIDIALASWVREKFMPPGYGGGGGHPQDRLAREYNLV